jgi:aspartate carbamoyltransferase catalytic subunit
MERQAVPSPANAEEARAGMRGTPPGFSQKHLLGIADLNPYEILDLLDRAEAMIPISRQERKSLPTLAGKTQINLFFEPSTRTQGSFEIAGKRLGALVMNMAVKSSSVSKGETLIDTAATLNAMRPDVIVVRHAAAGAVQLLSQKVGCSVVNAGDGAHEHPTQALLDALTIRRHKGRLDGLTVAICGDIANSRVARSNLLLLGALQIRTRVIAPRTLLPSGIEQLASEIFTDMREGLRGADVVMMLRLQHERAAGKMIPSVREYYRFYGLDAEKLAWAKPDAIVMHPGPMNRGVEIDPVIADGARSVITDQVEMGVAVRMAVLDALLAGKPA